LPIIRIAGSLVDKKDVRKTMVVDILSLYASTPIEDSFDPLVALYAKAVTSPKLGLTDTIAGTICMTLFMHPEFQRHKFFRIRRFIVRVVEKIRQFLLSAKTAHATQRNLIACLLNFYKLYRCDTNEQDEAVNECILRTFQDCYDRHRYSKAIDLAHLTNVGLRRIVQNNRRFSDVVRLVLEDAEETEPDEEALWQLGFALLESDSNSFAVVVDVISFALWKTTEDYGTEHADGVHNAVQGCIRIMTQHIQLLKQGSDISILPLLIAVTVAHGKHFWQHEDFAGRDGSRCYKSVEGNGAKEALGCIYAGQGMPDKALQVGGRPA
jgi:hypothetical protein